MSSPGIGIDCHACDQKVYLKSFLNQINIIYFGQVWQWLLNIHLFNQVHSPGVNLLRDPSHHAPVEHQAAFLLALYGVSRCSDQVVRRANHFSTSGLETTGRFRGWIGLYLLNITLAVKSICLWLHIGYIQYQ